PLAAGTVAGSTRHGESANAGSCDHSDAREIVYQLDVPRRQRVVLDLDAKFDSVLYLRKDECGDESAEVECNDDAPNGGRNRSRIERVLDPGKYFVFVDGYNNETGAYKLTLTTSDVVALDDACRRARTLVAGTPVSDSTEGYADDATASCGGGAAGADTPWRIDVQARSRVRVVEHADAMSPVVHLRRACEDPDSETACGEGAPATNDAAVTGVLDPGRYVVFADARDADAAGGYSLSYETAPVDGSGTAGDGCGDAVPLAGTGGSVLGDTFEARDDVAGSCGGEGAADVVYRVDLTRRSRFHAYLPTEEAPHRLALWRRCGDRGAEIACGPTIDDVLAPGTYFLGVDGATPEALGRFSLFWTAQDLAPQAAACSNAPALLAGRTVTGTTGGGGDRFATTCEGWDGSGTAPDRVYRLTLAARGKVHFEVDAAFDAYLALRRSCTDVSSAGASVQLACRGSLSGAHKATLETTLEAGTY
ncbi:MAG TPA: PPC domain-containing protein, partial [Polyangiaceae bacterium]